MIIKKTLYKKKEDKSNIGTGFIFLLRFMGGILIFISGVFLILNLVHARNSVLISARIAKIENKQVSVEYEYEGISYLRPLNYYHSEFQVGDELDINIDRRHPQQLFSSIEIEFLISVNILGLIIMAISFVPFKDVKKKPK